MKYSDAGVSREAGYEIVDRIRDCTAATHDAHVLGQVGGFGGLYRLGAYRDPVLVSGTDGVGTKLHLAVETGRLGGIGIDCVAMCVNDILCHGADPLFFLDYLAYADLDPGQAAAVVAGVAEGCRQGGCALIGGESAQMPGTYRPGDFDIAGFAVGVVERPRLVDGTQIRPGDRLIGLASSGVHSNGFSLVRALLREKEIDLGEDFGGRPLGEVLLEPTRIYVKTLLPLIEAQLVRGMAHITGGGLYENVPRMFPAAGSSPERSPGSDPGSDLGSDPARSSAESGGGDSAMIAGGPGLRAVIYRSAIRPPDIFSYLQSLGVDEEEMLRTFNMGIGMVCAAAPEAAGEIIKAAEAAGIAAREIGIVERGENGVWIE